MIYSDRVYGTTEIIDPLILELMKSSGLERLKGVDQRGYFEPQFPGTAHSRFEHSVGVYLLLKKCQASIEEQVAGLIHDVSHGVFSHCIDYVLNTGSEEKQDLQDNIFKDFVKNTDIPAILTKHNMDISYILDEDNFPLKEKSLPDLCADRIDYSLRTAVIFNEIGDIELNRFFDNLSAKNSSWVFNNPESAREFAQLFYKLNSLYYAGLPTAIMFATVKDYLQHALMNKYISKEDLFTTDKNVLEKIEKHLDGDEKLKLLFDRMDGKIKIINNPDDFDIDILVKSRAVDPWCQSDGKIQKLSDIDKDWGKVVQDESIPKEYFLKFQK